MRLQIAALGIEILNKYIPNGDFQLSGKTMYVTTEDKIKVDENDASILEGLGWYKVESPYAVTWNLNVW